MLCGIGNAFDFDCHFKVGERPKVYFLVSVSFPVEAADDAAVGRENLITLDQEADSANQHSFSPRLALFDGYESSDLQQ